jgi:Uncharacterised protein family (UPF0175)
MSVCIELPTELETELRRQIVDLDRAAKEALLVDLYRQERITSHELASALGIDRFAADELLSRHGVTEDLPSLAALRAEATELEARLGR